MSAKSREKRKPPSAEGTADDASFGEILAKLPEGTPPEVIETIAQSIHFSGPIPPPSMFKDYDEVLPGSADRILSLAENEQKMRGRDNTKILWNDTARVWGSIVVSLWLVAAGVVCAYLGEPWLGGVLGASGAVSGVIRAFLRTS